MWCKPSSSRLPRWPTFLTSFWHKTACLNNIKNSCALLEKKKKEVFDHFTLPPLLPGKLLKQERFVSSKWIDFTQVPFSQQQHVHLSVLPFFTNSPKPQINIQYNCLSVPSAAFFSLIHIYVGLIHTVELSNLKPKSHFKRLSLYLYVCRLTLVSLGFCLFASDCSALLFSPLQLAGLHVNMVKNPAQCDCPWWKRAKESNEWHRHFLPRTLRVDGGYLSPPSNTPLPQSLFQFFFVLSFLLFQNKSFYLCLSIPASFNPFTSIFLRPPFCPPQHMLDLRTPSMLLPVCLYSLGC